METNPYQSPNAVPPSFRPQLGPPVLGIKQILFSFQGRIPRRTYWLWRISLTVAFFVLAGLTAPLMAMGVDHTAENPGVNPIGVILLLLLCVPAVWIGLALTVKRWHDREKSGVWCLIALIPLVGPIWSFVECGCLRGTFGDNQYGPDPT